MIRTLEVSLGGVVAAQLDPPAIGVPVVEPGQVLASGYYTEQTSGQLYYYDVTDDQWYYVSATGLLYALAISWKPSPTAKIDLDGGETLRFNLTFKYMGPAVTRSFYAAIGSNKMSGTFAEWSGFNKVKDMLLPAYDTPTLITGRYVDIVVPTGSHGGEDGAAYCKIVDGFTLIEGENCTPYYYDVPQSG